MADISAGEITELARIAQNNQKLAEAAHTNATRRKNYLDAFANWLTGWEGYLKDPAFHADTLAKHPAPEVPNSQVTIDDPLRPGFLAVVESPEPVTPALPIPKPADAGPLGTPKYGPPQPIQSGQQWYPALRGDSVKPGTVVTIDSKKYRRVESVFGETWIVEGQTFRGGYYVPA